MKLLNSKYDSPTNLLPEESQQTIYNYLDIAQQCCLSFQETIRRRGVRSFNVYLFLEQEFFKYYSANSINRKPPKAVTIEQWFNGNHLSGSKMGTEDLKLICSFIDNIDPVIAYYEEVVKELLPNSISIISETTTLTSLILRLSKLQGELSGDYEDAIRDGKITDTEAAMIIASADAVTKQAEKVKQMLHLKKVG